jgi:sugar/nucleoside kinase (ribokinase family)
MIQKNLGQKRPNKATLIIKQGGYGCLMRNQDQWFSLPAFPLENVYDPTGAGDAFAGGFMGFLASQKKSNEKNLKNALIYGTVMASFAVEKIGPYNLTDLKLSQIKNRASKLREIVRI